MSSNAIYKAVKRSNMNMLILSIIALAIAIGVGVYWSVPYFMAKFTGPTKLDEAALSEITSASGTRYFQQITADVAFDSGYEEYTEYEGGRQVTDAYFAVAVVGERIVIVRSRTPINEEQLTYLGTFKQPDSVQREIFADFRREVPDAADFLVPLMLDMDDSPTVWYGGTAVLIVILLGGIWGIITYLQRTANPHSHPIFKKLSRFGDIDKVVDSIDKELGALPDDKSNIKVTRNWLVYTKGGAFQATRLTDLLWLYKHVLTQKAYGVVTTGRTFSGYFCDRHGESIIIQGKEDYINQVLQVVLSHAPWAIGGYSEDLKRAWDKDRQQLVAAVDQRKAQYDAQSPFA